MKRRRRVTPTTAAEAEIRRLAREQQADDTNRVEVTAAMEAILAPTDRQRSRHEQHERWIFDEARQIAGKSRTRAHDPDD